MGSLIGYGKIMLVSRLGFSASRLCSLNRPVGVLLQRNFAKNDIDLEDGKPIPYSSSPAASWKAEYQRKPPVQWAWFTPHVVSLSVGVFMLYFCVLREENDLDELIYRPLPETIIGIDKAFPGYNFNQKPDYVVFHEKNRALKMKEKEPEKVPS